MFETMRPGADPGTTTPELRLERGSGPPDPVPLERLEAQICELAGHLTAATCRFLVLLADFDARRGWASWDMPSCAAWLSWKCQMTSGTAREHVRVARALRDLPVLRGEFGAGRLSYAKVRALTRIATPENEGGLAEIAGPMTGNQLERFARAHRRVTHADDAAARVRRRLAWRFEGGGAGEHLRGAHADRGAVLDIQHWIHGGRTRLKNLISLCPYHHKLVHERGYLIAAPPGGFAFYRPDGTALPPSPALPPPGGAIGDCHDAEITPGTIIPPWYGERLDLDYAIYTCFANDRNQQGRQDQRDQRDEAEMFQPRAWVAELSDSIDWI
jgi:hypothetical protein